MKLPVVVIGGSAGALSALLELAGRLPKDFPGAVLVALHLLPDQPSLLADILTRAGPLPAAQARGGEELRPGHIYTAPPDHHLLLGQDRLTLARPARKPLAPQHRRAVSLGRLYPRFPCGRRDLSGMLDDGVSGLWTVKQLGGLALAQHPEEAEYPSMPLSAVRRVEVDDILFARELAGRLAHWANNPPAKEHASMDDSERRRLETEIGIAAGESAFEAGILDSGALSPFTCPECHGAMVRLREGGDIRFRCHTGHAYSSATLIAALRLSVEASLWDAVRTLEEDVMLLEHLAKHHDEAGQSEQAAAYRAEEGEARARAPDPGRGAAPGAGDLGKRQTSSSQISSPSPLEGEGRGGGSALSALPGWPPRPRRDSPASV